MKSFPGLADLKEGAHEWGNFYQRLFQKQMSRRRVLKVGAVAALVGSSGTISQFLAACAEEEKKSAETGTPGAAATTGPFAGVTGDWDTTKTPPYKQGLPDDVAKIPEQWKQYPWTYKYGGWRYNWNIPVTRGGHLIFPQGPPANFDAMVSAYQLRAFNDALYNIALREGMKVLGPTIEPVLALKEEHNADYTSWTITIPEGVKWHNIPPVNGRVMTAEDVAFSFQRHADTSVYKSTLRYVEKTTAVDKTHVRFDLKRPALDMPALLAFVHFVVIAPEHFENKDRFKAQAIGTGPFMLEFNEFQNKEVFVRNPDYWRLPPVKPEKYGNKPLPLVDRITHQFFANNVAAKEAFFRGQVDYFSPGGGLDIDILREISNQIPDSNVMVAPYYVCCPSAILFQFKNPLFQDIRVRRALSMAIDREQIWRDVTERSGGIAAHPIPFDFMDIELPPPLKEYGPNAQYNPDQAKQLLNEAGLTLPLRLKIFASPPSNAMWQAILDAAVFQWRKAGVVDGEVVVREAQVLTQDKLNKSYPDLLWEPCCVLAQGYTLDSQVPPVFLPDSPTNYGSIDDPALTALFDKYGQATDPKEATKLASQMGQRILENVDHLWLGWIPGMEVTRSWDHGSVLSTRSQPHGYGQYNYAYMWIDQTAPEGRGGKPV